MLEKILYQMAKNLLYNTWRMMNTKRFYKQIQNFIGILTLWLLQSVHQEISNLLSLINLFLMKIEDLLVADLVNSHFTVHLVTHLVVIKVDLNS